MTQFTPQFPVYRDRPVALLTRHHKANVIAPPLALLGLEVHSTDAFDTDTLGTFSGEIERKLSPLDCARRKARLACELTGLSIGLGSEGSFGGGPLAGLMNWDEELLVLVDLEHDLEITAVSSGPVQLSEFAPHSVADVQRQLAPFPADQGWILKLPNQISKGLVGPEQVAAQLEDWQLTNEAGDLPAELQGTVTLEPDLRAMHCPQRRDYIGRAAQQLAERLQSLCPGCGAPDFWRRQLERGLPCAWCAEPTELPRAFISRCLHCGHESRTASEQPQADPGNCPQCNP